MTPKPDFMVFDRKLCFLPDHNPCWLHEKHNFLPKSINSGFGSITSYFRFRNKKLWPSKPEFMLFLVYCWVCVLDWRWIVVISLLKGRFYMGRTINAEICSHKCREGSITSGFFLVGHPSKGYVFLEDHTTKDHFSGTFLPRTFTLKDILDRYLYGLHRATHIRWWDD